MSGTSAARRRTKRQAGSRDTLGRLAVTMVRNRRRVYIGWLIAATLGLLGLPHLLGSLTSPPSLVTGSESARAAEVLGRGIPTLGQEQMLMVLHSEELEAVDPRFRAATDASMKALRQQDGVAGVLLLPVAGDQEPPRVLATVLEPLRGFFKDARTAYVLIGTSGGDRERQDRVPAQQAAADKAALSASDGRVSAHLVGPPAFAHLAQEVEITDLAQIELFAVPAALLVLLFGLRAPIPAMLPLAVAGASVVSTLGLFALVADVLPVDGALLIAVSAIGMGAGVDYALFVVSRFREESAGGAAPEQAATAASATSGRTVVYSGLIVIVSIASLFLVRWPIFQPFAWGIAVVVTVAMVASLTLLPGLLVSLAGRLEWRSWGKGPQRTGATRQDGRLAAWSRHLMRHPWPYAVTVIAGLMLLALPAADLRLGIDLERRALAETPFGAGMAVLERDAPGMVSSITVLVQRPTSPVAPDVSPLVAALRVDPEVAVVTKIDNGRDLTALIIIPRSAADSPQIPELVRRIRGEIVPKSTPDGHTVLIGGAGAAIDDMLTECARKLWWVIGAVLLLMFGLLVVVLRSLLLPLKAIAMNLLATGAAFGLVVLLFQRGAAAEVFGFTPSGTLWPQIPILVFVLLFAISMDYEMFLVRRIQEEYRTSGDNVSSVATGMQRTARSITIAALIMVVAFGSLLLSSIGGLKAFGFAIATALIIDATLIRLVLVPALMKIMGRWNWWLPFSPVTQPAALVPSSRRESVTDLGARPRNRA